MQTNHATAFGNYLIVQAMSVFFDKLALLTLR